MDSFIKRLWNGGLNGGGFLVAFAISLAISALSYGLQVLLAKKPPTQFGPRADDLGAPFTNTGRPIPKATGRNQATAQVIWSTPLVETRNTKKVGGKGGGKKQKQVTYTYSISVALAVNDGEICGYNRILANESKTIWSQGFAAELTAAEINTQVTAKYDEVYAEQLAIWSAVIDPVTMMLKYTTAEAETLAATNATNTSTALRNQLNAANSDVKPRYSSIEFYYGTETQNPSPTIEGFEGAGNVSGYRGVAYIVIADLELADFGNVLPGFSIDYATAGTATSTFGKSSGVDNAPAFGSDRKVFVDWNLGVAYLTDEDGFSADTFILEYDLETQAYTRTLDLTAQGASENFTMGIDRDTGYLYGYEVFGVIYWHIYDPVTGTMIYDQPWTGDTVNDLFGTGLVPWLILTSPDGLTKNMMSYDPAVLPTAQLVLFYAVADGVLNTKFLWPSGFVTGCQPVEGAPGEAFLIIWSSSEARVLQYELSNAGAVTETQIMSFTPADIGVSAFKTNLNTNPEAHYDSSSRSIVFAIETTESAAVSRYWVSVDVDLASIRWSMQYESSEDTFINITAQQTQLGASNVLAVLPSGSSTDIAYINIDSGAVTLQESGESYLGISDEKTTFYDGVTNCLYAFQFDNTVSGFQQLDKFCAGGICFIDPISLGDIIRNYMGRAGYLSSEYEIDAAVDAETIWGFSDNKGMSTRELLEDLARIRPVIVNEIEGKLRFRMADQSVVATIPIADVRAYDGSSEPPEWINDVQTLEDLALPKTLRITYRDIDRALNPATAAITREITQSTSVEELSVEAVDTSESMRNSVFNAMSVLMAGKRSFKVSLPLKYSVLEPGDVIVIPVSDTNTATARVQSATLGANNIIELELNLYINTNLGVVHTDQFTAVSTDTATGTPLTTVFLLDTPYLSDTPELNAAGEEDDGIYIAFASTSTQWPGANLYVDQQTLDTEDAFGVITQVGGTPVWELAAVSSATVAAGTIAGLPDPTASPLVQDLTSTLIVAFWTPGAEFETIGLTATLSTTDNAFLVGNEIIQAQTVELLNTAADGLVTYAFTNLWRGLHGTEWAIGTQVLGDTVVHLDDSSIQRIDLANSSLVGLTVDFRAVTVNSDLTATDTTSLVYTGASQKPYAPWIENVIRDGSGNLTFELTQRNRYGNLWTPAIPAFESDPDDFEVDIVIAGSPSALRTIVVSGTNVISYTAAQQVTDFGSTQSAIDVAAYQLNADGRRGFATEETV